MFYHVHDTYSIQSPWVEVNMYSQKPPKNITLLQTQARHNAPATICPSASAYFDISLMH